MGIAYRIAKRYLFSKKRQHIINYMNMVSVIGITFATAALVIVLSVFNGFGELISRLHSSFQPAFLLESKQAKHFLWSDVPMDSLKNVKGIAYVQPVIQESALLRYQKRQSIVKLKAVQNTYMEQSGLDSLMVQGEGNLQHGGTDFAVLGYGIAYKLQVQLNDRAQLQAFLPKHGVKGGVQLHNAFRRVSFLPAGFFSVRQDFDDIYVFVPQYILQAKDSAAYYASALEIGLLPSAEADNIQQSVQNLVGNTFSVKNRMQQQAIMQKVMQSEKAMIYLVLGFILLLAIFNIIGSISMLIVDKQPDMIILKAMGASKSLMLSIFAWEGVLITVAGGFIGMLLGAVVVYGQQTFGWVSLGEGNFIVDAYPVRVIWQDFLWIAMMLILMSGLAILYPIRQLSRKSDAML